MDNGKLNMDFERGAVGGMRCLLAPRPGSGIVAAAAVILRGSADEVPDQHGVASFATGMLQRGTENRSSEQMAYDLESLGAMVGVSDGVDTCAFSVRSAAAEARAAHGIMFEALRRPAFDAQELEIQRKQVLAEIRMADDDKFDYTYRHYLKAMFAGHGYGHTIEGEVPDVEAITPDACRIWHRTHVRPESILYVAVGDFDTGDWRAMLHDHVAEWPVETPPIARVETTPSPERRVREVNLNRPELQQGFIVVGFPSPNLRHPDYPALRLASAVLGEGFGGRLFAKLRDERGLAYAVGSALRNYRLAAHQVLYIGTKPESIDEARDGLLDEAEHVRSQPLDEPTLNRAREYVIGSYWMGLQSHAQRARNLAAWEDGAGDAALGADWPNRLRAVTAEQIQQAARTWWREPTIAILRPA